MPYICTRISCEGQLLHGLLSRAEKVVSLELQKQVAHLFTESFFQAALTRLAAAMIQLKPLKTRENKSE